jgi:hypothetical protein
VNPQKVVQVYGGSFPLYEAVTWPSSDIGSIEETQFFDTVTMQPGEFSRFGLSSASSPTPIYDYDPSPVDPRWVIDYFMFIDHAAKLDGTAAQTGLVLTIVGGVMDYTPVPPAPVVPKPFNLATVVLQGQSGALIHAGTPVLLSGDILTPGLRGTIRGSARFLRVTLLGLGTAATSFGAGVYLRAL